MNINPTQKVELMRMYGANPVSAVLWLAELLRMQMGQEVEAAIRREAPKAVAEAAAAARESVKKSISPEDVARALAAMPAFLRSVRGADGSSVSVADVVDELVRSPRYRYAVKGDPGKSPTADEVARELARDRSFVESVAPEEPDVPTAGDVARELAADRSFVDSVRGEDGKDANDDTPDEVAAKLNSRPGIIEPDAVKGLSAFMRSIQSAVREKGGVTGGKGGSRRVGGGGNIVEYYDLSDLCDGATKSFAIPYNRRILEVKSTQAPIVYRPSVDWTGSGTKTLTLTSEVDAPQQGQTLYIIYVR